jgi:hypothetical protein
VGGGEKKNARLGQNKKAAAADDDINDSKTKKMKNFKTNELYINDKAKKNFFCFVYLGMN